MKKKNITLAEWKEMGDKAKDVRKSMMELLEIMRNHLPQSQYLSKWQAAEKSYGKLRSHLDDLVCGDLINEPDNVVTHIFYGDNDK